MNITPIALGGFQQAEKQLASIAGKIARLPLAAASVEDTTDLAGSMVELNLAQRSAEVNLLALHAADEINRATLDVFG